VQHTSRPTQDDPPKTRAVRVGKQKIEDPAISISSGGDRGRGFLDAAMKFIDKNARPTSPFFAWVNSTRMHIFTHLKPSSKGKTGLGLEADGMVEHDGMVGQLLKQLDDLGIADNTIVIWTTDNGAESSRGHDGGTHAVPRREK
jgi:arylsulfatase